MTALDDPAVVELLAAPNYGVISTLNEDGSVHSCVVWLGLEGTAVALNSNTDRVWPRNLARNPRATVLVFESGNPYYYVEIRGRTTSTQEGAKEQIDELSKQYLGKDPYPYLQPGEQRVKFLLHPDRIRLYKQ